MGAKPGYRADIDGLRAVAVLAVLFFHAGLSFPGGFVGVDVFFVISGYLITRLIVADLERGTFTFRNFWTRRLRRIWPAASVMTLATLLVGAVLLAPKDYHQLATDAIPQMLMLANVQFMRGTDYFGVAADLRALLHTWSLAVEEQFYLFHPFIVVLIWRWRAGLLLPAFVVAGLASFALSVALLEPYPSATFYMLPTRAWELLIGGAIALAPGLTIRSATRRLVIAAVGLALVIVPMFLYDRATPFPGLAALPPCLGTGLLIIAGTGEGNSISRMIACGPMRWVGGISYSLYLVHWPILAIMRTLTAPDEPTLGLRVGALLVSFPLAYLSWRFVENRFRHAKGPARFGRVVAGSVGIAAVVIGLSVFIRTTDGWRGRFSGPMLAHIDPEAVNKSWQSLETRSRDIAELTRPIGDAGGGDPCFVLWGDSHGMAVSELIDELAKEAGVSGVARLRSATPPAPGVWSPAGGREAAGANQRVLDWILENRVPNVILAARWTVEVDGRPTGPHSDRLETLVRPLDETGSVDPEQAAAALGGSIRALAETLDAHGIRLWILLEVPRQRTTPQNRAIISRITLSDLPTRGVTRDEHEAHTANARAAIEEGAGLGVHLVDLSVPFFEGGEAGSVLADERRSSYYADDDHLTPGGARAVLGELVGEMVRGIAATCRDRSGGADTP